MPPPPKMNNHRIITVQFPVEIDAVLRELALGTKERSFLGRGTLTSCLDTRKSAQGEKTWWMFDVEGELRLAFATPKLEDADDYFTSNCGEQDMILADVYNQSLYAAPGFSVHATKLIGVVIKFESRSDLDGRFHHSYGIKGRQFLKDWYDKGARLFRGPSSAPYTMLITSTNKRCARLHVLWIKMRSWKYLEISKSSPSQFFRLCVLKLCLLES